MNESSKIGVGMLGYQFMGKAHAHAYRALAHMDRPPEMLPELVSIAGRSEQPLAAAAARYGFAEHTTDWRELIADPRIGVFDNSGPNNLHAEPTIEAAEAGKHVICEKPLGRSAEEAHRIWRRVENAGVVHMCAFNYRFVPALRLARELIRAGDLGEVFHFRARYLQDWIADPDAPMAWRLTRAAAGSGALGDLGAHLVDLGRYLVGEPTSVTGSVRTFVPERGGERVDVDDAFEATVEFESGAVGTIEASRFCTGRKNALALEINGSKGSLAFELERINELQLYALDGSSATRGFRTILVTEPEHPFLANWWPPGHVLGWEHTFIHELHHLLAAVAEGRSVGPDGATFEDGYRAAEICDAILRAAETGSRQEIAFRGFDDDLGVHAVGAEPMHTTKQGEFT
jgi:predicted dehydrogenase